MVGVCTRVFASLLVAGLTSLLGSDKTLGGFELSGLEGRGMFGLVSVVVDGGSGRVSTAIGVELD